MSDCLNVEMRELLPELMHGTLPPGVRESVEAHVTSCRDCAEELTVLRTARRVMSAATPRVDVASIVRALPAPPRAGAAARPGNGKLFRIAAAISFISLGGISLAVARSYFDGGTSTRTDSVAADVTRAAEDDSSRLQIAEKTAEPGTGTSARPELSVGGGVSDLATDDLETLLGELERLEAAPDAEPDHNPGGAALPGGVGGIEE